jgi:recombination protein RecT
MYWGRKKMEAHAVKYSKGYAADKKKGTSWTFWSKDFDGMAYKTMLRQLISKWGIMSIEMQKAFESDVAAEIAEDGSMNYVENAEHEQGGPVEAIDVPFENVNESAEASFFGEVK